MEKLRVQLDKGAFAPTRAHDWDAGLDLYTPESFLIVGGGYKTIDTGVHVEIPEGYVGMIKSKSGLNIKREILTEGVIDAGYSGSIKVKFYCQSAHGDIWAKKHAFNRGDKIAQLVILPIVTPEVELVDSIEAGERGDNGFGSTGR